METGGWNPRDRACGVWHQSSNPLRRSRGPFMGCRHNGQMARPACRRGAMQRSWKTCPHFTAQGRLAVSASRQMAQLTCCSKCTASASDGTLSRRLRLPAAALRGSLCRSAELPGPCDDDAASGEKEAVEDEGVRTGAFAAVDRSGAGAAGVVPRLGAPSVLGGPGVGFDGWCRGGGGPRGPWRSRRRI